MQPPINRIIKHGKFDWGSFSAFEDGSIEVEIAGVKQWFRNFSELERGLKIQRAGMMGLTVQSRLASTPVVSDSLTPLRDYPANLLAFSFAAVQASDRKCGKLILLLSSWTFLPEKELAMSRLSLVLS